MFISSDHCPVCGDLLLPTTPFERVVSYEPFCGILCLKQWADSTFDAVYVGCSSGKHWNRIEDPAGHCPCPMEPEEELVPGEVDESEADTAIELPAGQDPGLDQGGAQKGA